jgi:hypothetical protein
MIHQAQSANRWIDMAVSRHEILERAIGEKLTAQLSVPGTAEREWKLRLLATGTGADEGIWVQALDEKKADLNALISRGAEVEVAFTFGTQRSRFLTVVQKRNRHFWVTESMLLEALLLKWPREMLPGERRAHPRYPVADDGRILAELFRASQWAPAAERQIRVKLWNVSLGGAGFVTPLSTSLLSIPPGEPMRVVLQHEGRRFEIPAKLVANRTTSGNTLKFGVEFDKTVENWGTDAAKGLRELIAALERREALRAKARSTAKAS